MRLSPQAARVLGCLVEKARTTPDQYPLSLNAVVTACNQTTNRWPVVRYGENEVEAALDELRAFELVRREKPHGGRAIKYSELVGRALVLDEPPLRCWRCCCCAAPDAGRAEGPHRAAAPVRRSGRGGRHPARARRPRGRAVRRPARPGAGAQGVAVVRPAPGRPGRRRHRRRNRRRPARAGPRCGRGHAGSGPRGTDRRARGTGRRPRGPTRRARERGAAVASARMLEARTTTTNGTVPSSEPGPERPVTESRERER